MSAFAQSISEITVITPWGAMAEGNSDEENHITADQAAERHRLYSQLALDLMNGTFPWLPEVLKAIGASVIAGPWSFHILGQNGELLHVPEISNQLNLLPWAEPNETAH